MIHDAVINDFALFDENVLQKYPDTCAIKSQQIILNSKDVDVSEETLRNDAILNGWYESGKVTPMECTGFLLERYGVSVYKIQGASLLDLSKELVQGHGVVVGVDSGELWNPGIEESFEDIMQGVHADHALIVNGIGVDPYTSEAYVNLTDSGTGYVNEAYPVNQFLDAWADSGNYMLTTF